MCFCFLVYIQPLLHAVSTTYFTSVFFLLVHIFSMLFVLRLPHFLLPLFLFLLISLLLFLLFLFCFHPPSFPTLFPSPLFLLLFFPLLLVSLLRFLDFSRLVGLPGSGALSLGVPFSWFQGFECFVSVGFCLSIFLSFRCRILSFHFFP